MRDLGPAPAVVVGIDGSQSATQAAIWAVDEAVSRDIPLRLVYVIDTTGLGRARSDDVHLASAHAALHDAQRAVETTGERVKIETEVFWGKPVTELREQSRSATMICIGSIGMTHACRSDGSVARALPGLSYCPVVVVRRPVRRSASPDVGSVVVEVDTDVVLYHAFEEARLRGAPVRAVASWQPETPDNIADGNRLAQAQLNRRVSRWQRMYPDVAVEAVAVPGDVGKYLAAIGESVQLFVTGVSGRRLNADMCERAEWPVFTVRGNHL